MLSDDELIALVEAGRSVYWISRTHGVPHTSLHRRVVALGLSVAHRSKARADKVKDRADEVLRLHDEGRDRGEIARIIGCDRSSVSRLLKKHGRGGSIRTHTFDESFFDIIDRPEKAYCLGLFVTDGTNMGNSASYELTDADIVHKVARAVRYSGEVRAIQPMGRQRQVTYILDLCSTRICAAPEALGCPRRKTFVTCFPEYDVVPRFLIPHYIRGVFDGDGSLYRTTNGWHLGIAGTMDLLEPILNEFRVSTGIRVGGIYRQGKIWQLKVPGIANCRAVLGWLYRDSTIHMDRKHARYLAMISG